MWSVLRSRLLHPPSSYSLRSSLWSSGFGTSYRMLCSSVGAEAATRGVLNLQEVEKVLNDVKADDITVIPVGRHCDWADFMVVATGRSTWHVKNIAQALIYQAKQKQRGLNRMVLPSVEGLETGKWVVIDSGRVIVHAFDEKARSYYNLEKLWVMEATKNEPAEEGLEMMKPVLNLPYLPLLTSEVPTLFVPPV